MIFFWNNILIWNVEKGCWGGVVFLFLYKGVKLINKGGWCWFNKAIGKIKGKRMVLVFVLVGFRLFF